jgi:hydrogenase maturation protease
MNKPFILVAGIGNIFLGDDAFGVEVVRALAQRQLQEGVRVIDFGIRGLDLSYALVDGYELVILVDACQRGGAPGTLYEIEPDLAEEGGPEGPQVEMETHGLVPSKALSLARVIGSACGNIRLVACEPASFEVAEEGEIGLSAPVRNAVAEAIQLIETLITKFAQSRKQE